jgi:hypothetical protein
VQETSMQYKPSPMTAEQVADLHEALWEALITLPIHRHTARSTKECMNCKGRRMLVKAYQMLPVYLGEFKHLPTCRSSNWDEARNRPDCECPDA